MKKVRSSQRAIPVLSWVKHQSFPVSIVKDRKCFWIFDFLLWHSANEKHLPSQLPVELFALKNCYRALLFAWYWYKKIFMFIHLPKLRMCSIFPLTSFLFFQGHRFIKNFRMHLNSNQRIIKRIEAHAFIERKECSKIILFFKNIKSELNILWMNSYITCRCN